MLFRERLLAGLVFGAVAVSAQAGDHGPLPYRLLVSASYGEPLGPESLRNELERELAERIDVAGCFESVVRQGSAGAAEAELVAEVVLDRYAENTRHDVTIATQKRPGEPGSDLHWSAEVSTLVQIQVRRAGDRAVVKIKRKSASVTRRAQPAEDTRFEAQATLVESIVREVRSYLCKGSPRKWAKQIREARPVAHSD